MNITELKKTIKSKIPKEYEFKSNFSSPENLIEIGNLMIIAKPICTDKEVKYEFMLDTQFIYSKEISYDEIVLVKNIIEILEENRKVAISRLKKWKPKEFLQDRELKEKKSKEMIEALKKHF